MGLCSNSLLLPRSLSLVLARDYEMIRNVQWKAVCGVLRWWEQVNGVPLIHHLSEYKLRIRLVNGTDIIFRTQADIERIQGLQAQTIWADEYSIWEHQFHAWKEINSRLRPTAEGQRLKLYWTATPKGQFGITALLQEKSPIKQSRCPDVTAYVSPDETLEDAQTTGVARIHTTTLDNAALEDEYAEGLAGIFSPDEYAQEVLGQIIAVRGSVFGSCFSLTDNVRKFAPGSASEYRLAVDHGSNYPYACLVARDTDEHGEPRDTIIDEFTENDIRSVHQIIWWAQGRMRHWGISKLAAVYPDPDRQYRKENLALQKAFGCPVYGYSSKEHRSISWGTGLVKARLLDARDRRHLFVAHHLISKPQNTAATGRGCVRGFMTQEWAEKRVGRNALEELTDQWKDQPGTHGMDAIRYLVSHEYRYLNPDGSVGGQKGMIIYR